MRQRPLFVNMLRKRFSLSVEDAEDVLQDAVTAMIGTDNLRAESLGAYLNITAQRKAMDANRKRERRVKTVPLTFELDGAEATMEFEYHDPGYRAVERIDIDEVTSVLPPDQALAVKTWIEGKSDIDVCEEAGCCVTTYRTRRFRGVRTLHKTYCAEEMPPDDAQYVPAHRPRHVYEPKTLSKRLRTPKRGAAAS